MFGLVSSAPAPLVPQALLEQEKKSGRAKEARYKLQLERLRQQLLEVQHKAAEQREEIAYLEKQRLEHWGVDAGGHKQPAAAAGGAANAGASAPPKAGAHTRSAAPAAAAAGAPADGAVPQRGRQQARGPPRVEGCGDINQVVVRKESRRGSDVAMAGGTRLVPASAQQAASAEQDESSIVDVQPSEEEVEEEGHALWDAPVAGEREADGGCKSDGEGMAELLDETAVRLQRTSPAVRVAAHRAGRSATAQAGTAAVVRAWPTSTQLVRAAGEPPRSAHPSRPGTAAGQEDRAEAGSNAMARASAALDRFNQLKVRQSAGHVEQGQLPQPSRPGTQVPNSLPTSAASTPSAGQYLGAEPAPAPAATADDLRRLGRMLTASCGEALSMHGQQQQPPQPPPPQLGMRPATSVATSPAPFSAADYVVSFHQHPDGRIEQAFASGLREQQFANGALKRWLPDGCTITRLANGDLKRVFPTRVTGE